MNRARLAAVLSACAALLACARSGNFHISGTITVASSLQDKAPRPNLVLFIIAKNGGSVPVAVRRIVNPQFPLEFSLDTQDLLVPGRWPGGPLTVEVQMNSHGNVGQPKSGDLEGTASTPVAPEQGGVYIVINRRV